MNAVYIINENGQVYPLAYISFASAVEAVKESHKKTLDMELNEGHGKYVSSEIDVPENKLTGKTLLYIYSGTHLLIQICKLPILSF